MQPQPSIVNAALKKALQLHQSGQLDQAEQIYRQLIAQVPKNADPYNLLGTLYHQRGKHRIAVELIQKALEVGPKKSMFYNNLGNALREKGEAKQAEKAFRKALKIEPKYASAMNNLGGILLAMGNISSAINVLSKTLKIDPNFYPARHNLGNAYYEKGEKNKAIQLYRQVLKQQPRYTKSARNLAETKKFLSEDDDFQLLKELSETYNFVGEDEANVLFALAKAQDDLKQYSSAFSNYLSANKAHRKTYTFDISDVRSEFEEIRETISPEFFQKFKGKGAKDNRPIFVLGMPRSGTSLVEQILASHKQVHGAGELYNLEKTYFYHIRDKGNRSFSEAFTNISDSFIKQLGDDYTRQLNELGSKHSFIVDKMPRNFIYTGLIKLILPNAKIIHCKRSPEDTCLSIFKKFFVGHQRFAYDLKELGEFYNLYLDHMNYWKSLLQDELYEIQYENLISDQQLETEKLLNYCQLEWDDACLDFYKTRRAVRTASTDQVRQPIYSSSVEAWRVYERELKPLTDILHHSVHTAD